MGVYAHLVNQLGVFSAHIPRKFLFTYQRSWEFNLSMEATPFALGLREVQEKRHFSARCRNIFAQHWS